MKHLLFALLFITSLASAQTGNYTHDVINPTGTSNQTYLMDVGIDTLSGSNDTLLVQFDRSFPGFYGITYTGVLAASSTSTTLKAELLGRNKSSETWVIIDMVELATEGVTISLESDLSYMYLALRYVSTANLAHVNSTILLKKKASSSSSVIKGTYTSIQSLVNNSMLKKGRTYEITDRGDRGIFLTAISPNKLSTTGNRLMLCPTTYATTGIWKGIWRSALLPSAGDLVIWGGHVWSNVSGNVGVSVDDVTLDAEWSIIDKETFTNNEYVEKLFGVSFDFENDWIEKQWDGNGNIVGISFNLIGEYSDYGKNYCDITDWNYATSGVPFSGNEAVVIFNNIIGETFINNKSYGYEISGNTVGGAVYQNVCIGGIISNVVQGRIYDNIVFSLEENIVGNSIIDNITGNTIGQNTVAEMLSFNTSVSSITGNTCTNIINNATTSSIEGNIVEDDISFNTNNGRILNNTNCTFISYNSNGGNISSNSHDGSIEYNRNNGNIENCTGSGGFSVIYNTNNGDIDGPAGLASADVTDAIVNK